MLFTKNLMLRPFQDDEAVKSFSGKNLARAVCLESTGELIGAVETYETPAELVLQEIGERTYSFGVLIAPPYQNKGYGIEAAEAMITAYFQANPDLNFIQGGCFQDNEGSRRLMRSMGFRELASGQYQGKAFRNFVRHRNHPHFDYDRYLVAERGTGPEFKISPRILCNKVAAV
jgi:RimJ/RimL family protein N-acetyltransferase